MQQLLSPPDLTLGASNMHDEIVEGLWLGTSEAARSATDRGVKAIVNCATKHKGQGDIDGVPVFDVETLSAAGTKDHISSKMVTTGKWELG